MLPDRVLNPGPLTYESGALPIALRGPVSPSERTIMEFSPDYRFVWYIMEGLEVDELYWTVPQSVSTKAAEGSLVAALYSYPPLAS